MMEEQAVRLILDVKKNSIKHAYVLLKKNYSSQENGFVFKDNELLNKGLSNDDFDMQELRNEYKKNGVDFFCRELADGKTELLLHASDKNLFLSVTEKVMRDMQVNPQRYLKKENFPKSEKGEKGLFLKDEIRMAKQRQAQMIAGLNEPKKNKRYNKNTSSKSGLRNDDVEL